MSEEKSLVTLNTPMEELQTKLLTVEDPEELKNIIDIFNLNIKRKDIARVGKLSELQDKISSQIEERLTKRAGEFNNKDLLDYFKTIQETINKADTSYEGMEKPPIQINQNQVNITLKEPSLDRDSKTRVADAVRNILANYTRDEIIDTEAEVVDVESVDENGEEDVAPNEQRTNEN